MVKSLLLLFMANIFMTFAWYGHLKFGVEKESLSESQKFFPLLKIILISWSLAFVEHCFQVPANRLGVKYFTIPQLKIIQEVMSMVVFSIVAITFLKVEITRNYFYASLCLALAVFFIFRK